MSQAETAIPQGVQEDATRFLRMLLSECSSGPTEHSWRKCRRCSAIAQLQDRDPFAVRLMDSAIRALEQGRAQAPAAENESAALAILTMLVPLVSDAAIVGATYGWLEVLAIVKAAADRLSAFPAPPSTGAPAGDRREP